MKKPTVRLATTEDFDFIFQSINDLENIRFIKSTQQDIFLKNLENENIIYLVAVVQSQHVGFLSCYFQRLLHHGGLVGEIQEMIVDPQSRGLGIGKLMLQKLETFCRARSTVQIEVSSNLRRLDAHRFYQQCGFRKTSHKFIRVLTNQIET